MSTFESYNELDLWKLFLEGDKEAFSVFYRHNYRKLYSYGISLGMDSELIDDIIQELFVKLYTRPQLIKDFSTIQAFLYAAVRNAFVNHEKQRKQLLYRRKHIINELSGHYNENSGKIIRALHLLQYLLG